MAHPPAPGLPGVPSFGVVAPPTSSCLGCVVPTYEPLKVCLDDDLSVGSASSVGDADNDCFDFEDDCFFREREIVRYKDGFKGEEKDDGEGMAAEYSRGSCRLIAAAPSSTAAHRNKRPRLGTTADVFGAPSPNSSPLPISEWMDYPCRGAQAQPALSSSSSPSSLTPSGELPLSLNFKLT